MFSGYGKKMIDFFFAVRFNNNREWFSENKQLYVTEAYEPTKALADDLCALMNKKYKRDFGWKCSRIYRDARRPCPDGPYKDKLWFILWERFDHWSETPTFCAEVSAEGISYGMGCYMCAAGFMKNFRAKAEADSGRLSRLISKFERDGIFDLYGEEYKRPKGSVSPTVDKWYNLKYFDFSTFEPWSSENMSAELPKHLAERLGTLMPIYRWLWDCVVPIE